MREGFVACGGRAGVVACGGPRLSLSYTQRQKTDRERERERERKTRLRPQACLRRRWVTEPFSHLHTYLRMSKTTSTCAHTQQHMALLRLPLKGVPEHAPKKLWANPARTGSREDSLGPWGLIRPVPVLERTPWGLLRPAPVLERTLLGTKLLRPVPVLERTSPAPSPSPAPSLSPWPAVAACAPRAFLWPAVAERVWWPAVAGRVLCNSAVD